MTDTLITERDGGFVVTNITGDRRKLLALTTIKHCLSIELKTGMRHSRGSMVTCARGWGYTGTRSKTACAAWVQAELNRLIDSGVNLS